MKITKIIYLFIIFMVLFSGAGHSLAAKWRFCPIHVDSDQESDSDDTTAAGLDNYKRTGSCLEGRERGSGAIGRAEYGIS